MCNQSRVRIFSSLEEAAVEQVGIEKKRREAETFQERSSETWAESYNCFHHQDRRESAKTIQHPGMCWKATCRPEGVVRARRVEKTQRDFRGGGAQNEARIQKQWLMDSWRDESRSNSILCEPLACFLMILPTIWTIVGLILVCKLICFLKTLNTCI